MIVPRLTRPLPAVIQAVSHCWGELFMELPADWIGSSWGAAFVSHHPFRNVRLLVMKLPGDTRNFYK